ncbi:MAG TPA: glycosyltransferase [Acidimicrobiia bacterium]|jgi:glycosyltransferase involved in cell wall biosynthesis|nr:glycosyltransferase [Acidimicrobiia bacterium]
MVTIDDLTLVITTFRRPEELTKTLKTLEDFPRVVVLINGSTLTEYQEVVDRFGGTVRFSQNLVNIGAAAAANRSIMETDTRYVVLSTDSCDYSDGWYRPLLELLDSDDPPHMVSLSYPRRFASWFIDKELIALQGWFDHNFTQAYYEDEDFYLRTLERLGLTERLVPFEEVVPVMTVATRRPQKMRSWNSIPNRVWFRKKWERVEPGTPGSFMLRENIAMRRIMDDPVFPYLRMVQERYLAGDYSYVPFVYDEPWPMIRALTRATTNPVVIGTRTAISKLTNPTQKLK